MGLVIDQINLEAVIVYARSSKLFRNLQSSFYQHSTCVNEERTQATRSGDIFRPRPLPSRHTTTTATYSTVTLGPLSITLMRMLPCFDLSALFGLGRSWLCGKDLHSKRIR